MYPIQLNYKFLDAVFFDFDGVLVESVSIKTKAYREIFKPYGEGAVRIITDYHLANGGIDRYKKISYVLNQIGRDAEKVNELAENFADLVKDSVIKSKSIEGSFELVKNLKEKSIATYIVSGTPEEELLFIVQERGWKPFFDGIYGSPNSKIEIVEKILLEKKYEKSRCIFLGDATTDYNTALYHNIWYIGMPSQQPMEL